MLIAPLLLVGFALQEWPQWRGPNRDGAVSEGPAAWPAKLKSVWKVPVGSGYSSPIVAGGAIFLQTREGEQEAVSRHDLATGHVLWRQTYAAPFEKNSYAKDMSKGPFSTPLWREGRLFTLGVSGTLSAWDSSSGDLLWRKSTAVDTSKLFTGSAMSPVFAAGFVIAHTGDDRGSRMTAFDPSSGAERWSLPMAAAPGYASPIVVDGSLVTMVSDAVIRVDAQTGKLLWSAPWKDEWIENIVTPVRFGDLVIFSGVRSGTAALRLADGSQAWRNADVAFYMSSPVLDGEWLYGLGSKRKGQFLCVNARTGRTAWSTAGREAAQAAVMSAGIALLWLTDAGELIVARKNPEMFESLARYSVSKSAAVWTHPVLLGRRLLVKSDNALSLWSAE